MVKYTKGVCVIVICTSFLFDKCIDCLLHTVWKNKKFTLILCEINFFVTSVVKTLPSRNFRQNTLRVNSCNFYTVLLTNYMPRSNGYIGLHLYSMYLIQYVIYKKLLFRKKPLPQNMKRKWCFCSWNVEMSFSQHSELVALWFGLSLTLVYQNWWMVFLKNPNVFRNFTSIYLQPCAMKIRNYLDKLGIFSHSKNCLTFFECDCTSIPTKF